MTITEQRDREVATASGESSKLCVELIDLGRIFAELKAIKQHASDAGGLAVGLLEQREVDEIYKVATDATRLIGVIIDRVEKAKGDVVSLSTGNQ